MDAPQPRHCTCDSGAAAARARTEVRRFLDDALGQGHTVSTALQDAALLVTSELVTNAVRHTPGPCSMDVSWSRDGIDIDVTDPSPERPRPRQADPVGTGGYGWPLVHRLASRVDVRSTPQGGKTIHVHLSGTP
ncbi:ATP-binding protein [Streptomyces sp. NPDC089799]|uniref:ATP-binding protein n=1 Tax=Streptomyces sp. NPDC089799 TaxID=3155066 RepID=UPI00343815D0